MSLIRTALVVAILAWSGSAEDALTKGCVAGSPCTAIPTQSWVKLKALGAPESAVRYENATYSGALGCHAIMGDYHGIQSENNRSIGCFSVSEQRWDVPHVFGYFHDGYLPDGGHPAGLLQWSDFYNFWFYLGGSSGSNQPEWTFHTFQIDGVGRMSRDTFTGNAANPKPLPGINLPQSDTVWDSYHNQYLILPDSAGAIQVYDPVSNLYSKPTVTGTVPPTLGSPSIAYNVADHKVYEYGGWTSGNACTGTPNTTIYSYDPGTRAWSTPTQNADTNPSAPNGGVPPGRIWSGWKYDDRNNIFLLTGGCNSVGDMSDTWAWHPDTGDWEWINVGAAYPINAGGADEPFWRLSYDRQYGMFILLKQGDNSTDFYGGVMGGSFSLAAYAFCYGACSNAGWKTNSYAPPAGWINDYTTSTPTSQTYVVDGSLAVDASGKIYAAMIQTGTQFDAGTDEKKRHCYVKSSPTGATWTTMGSGYCGENAGWEIEKPSVAIVNGTPWVSFSAVQGNPINNHVWAGSWSGTAWTSAAIGRRTTNYFQGKSQIFANGTTPMIAFIEVRPAGIGGAQTDDAYVDQYSGSWGALGGTLRRNAGGYVEDIAAVSDGTTPYVCHAERIDTNLRTVATTPQIYCEYWSGSAWTAIGGSLNIAPTNWANFVSVTYFGSHLYVAWTERTIGGNPKIYVAQCTTSACVTIGSALNRSVSGWATRPQLSNDGTNLYLSWEEQGAKTQPSRLYVASYNGSAWSAIGGALNMDTASGSAAYNSAAVVGGKPTVTWTETTPGNMRQAYAKQWNGTDWTALASAPQGPSVCLGCRFTGVRK